MMFRYYREKLHVNHFWEVKGSVLLAFCPYWQSLSRFHWHEAISFDSHPTVDGMWVTTGNILSEIYHVSATVCQNPFILQGEQSNCESRVSCPGTQHNNSIKVQLPIRSFRGIQTKPCTTAK